MALSAAAYGSLSPNPAPSKEGICPEKIRIKLRNIAMNRAAPTETILWVEADRMKGLNITQAELTNQQGVVVNEVKVNVLNRPYGGFPWLDMPQYANENWYNAHNFYGDLQHRSRCC